LCDLGINARRELLGEVLPDSASDDMISRLAEDIGGRPGVLMATLEHMVASGGLDVDGEGRVRLEEDIERTVPTDLRDLVAELLGGDEFAADAIQLLSVAGGKMAVEPLAAALEVTPPRVRSYLVDGPVGELVSIAETADGEVCYLEHAGVGRAVIEYLNDSQRKSLHDRCAAALSVAGGVSAAGSGVETTYHLLEGNRPEKGIAQILRILCETNPARDVLLPEETIRTALDHAREPQKQTLQELGGTQFFARGRFPEAAELLGKALDSGLPLSDPDRTVQKLTEALAVMGQHDEARRVLTEYIEQKHEEGNAADRARLQLALAWVSEHGGRFDEATECSSKALKAARNAGDPDLEAQSLRLLGKALVHRRKLAAACEMLEEARRVMDATGHPSGMGQVLNSLGYALMLRGDNARAVSCLREGLASLRSAGRLSEAAHALNNLGTIHQRECDWEQAARRYRSALDLYRRLGSETGIAPVLLNLAEVNITRGQIEDGLAQAGRVVHNTDLASHWRCHGLLRLAWAHSFLGDQEAAIRQGRQALDISKAEQLTKLQEAAHRRMGQIEGLRRNFDSARRHLETALEISRNSDLHRRGAVCLFRLADLSISRGRAEEAVALATQAVERASSFEIESIQALALWARGKAILESGDPEGALEDLRAAERFFADKQMCEELMDSASELGRAYHRLGRSRSALRYLRIALNIVEQIAERFESGRNRRVFLADARRVRIFERIAAVKTG
jgi:tetratricopeptide (TPR) repeat protein